MANGPLPGLLVAAAVAAMTSGSLIAAELTVKSGREGAPACAGTAVLEPLCDGAACPGAIELGLTAGKRPVDLAGAPRWRARIDSPDCWSAPVTIESTAVAAELVTWPLRHLTIAPTPPPGATLPAKIEGRVTAAAQGIDAPVSCIADGRKWTCPIPAIAVDLRLAADGFAPVYLWDIDDTETRRVTLARGASISGWVESANGPVAEAGVAIGKSAPQAATNSRGFFQLVGVQPGVSHSLTVKKAGRSTATVHDVKVEEGREQLLRDPIRLEELASLQISIVPPADPSGQPWSVRVARAIPMSSTFATVAAEQATLAGFWSRTGLETGTYSISITDGRGSLFERRQVEVTPGMPLLPFQISRIAVRGTVRAGESPLEAQVTFVRSGRRVKMPSDAEGMFRGVLPEAGEWDVEITPRAAFSVVKRTIDVARHDDGSEEVVEIELPAGRIEGSVVDEEGKPVLAVVNVRTDRIVAYGETDRTGRFALVGLKPNQVTVEAVTRDGASATVPYQVTGDESPRPLKIVLETRSVVEVRLVTPSGAPMPGAIVRQIIPPWHRRMETESGPDGRFNVQFTSSAPVVDVVVFAAGFPIKIARLSAAKSPVTIALSPSSARLKVKVRRAPPWPFLRTAGGSVLSLSALMVRIEPGGMPRGMVPGGFEAELEPGTYTVCAEEQVNAKCEVVALRPGAVMTVDGREWSPPIEGPPAGIAGTNGS